MKKFILSFAIALGISNSFAVEIPDSLLTPEQKAVISAKTTRQVTSEWVGIGKEVGEAVNSSMSAITQQTNNFANTPVGHYVLWIVAYVVLKKLIIAAILIPILGIFSLLYFILTYKYIYKTKERWTDSIGFLVVSWGVLALVNVVAIIASIVNI